MSYNWGPHFIVPTGLLKKYSGAVLLREELNEELLNKELESLGLAGPVLRVLNPWYFRKKGSDTWIKIGESSDQAANFPVRWDTRGLVNGKYEVLGLMHVSVKPNGYEKTIARQSIVDVNIEN